MAHKMTSLSLVGGRGGDRGEENQKGLPLGKAGSRCEDAGVRGTMQGLLGVGAL